MRHKPPKQSSNSGGSPKLSRRRSAALHVCYGAVVRLLATSLASQTKAPCVVGAVSGWLCLGSHDHRAARSYRRRPGRFRTRGVGRCRLGERDPHLGSCGSVPSVRCSRNRRRGLAPVTAQARDASSAAARRARLASSRARAASPSWRTASVASPRSVASLAA